MNNIYTTLADKITPFYCINLSIPDAVLHKQEDSPYWKIEKLNTQQQNAGIVYTAINLK